MHEHARATTVHQPQAPPRRQRRARSGLRHDGRSAHDAASAQPSGPPLLLLLRRLPHASSPPIRRSISPQARRTRRSRCRRARSTPARCIRRSARSAPAPARSAAWRSNPSSPRAETGAQSRTRRHDAAVLDRPRADAAGVRRSRWARTSSVRTAGSIQAVSNWFSSRSRRRSCCGRAGRSSCAAGNRCVTRNLNMFTLIAMGTGVAYLYSVVATLRARPVSGRRSAATAARSRSISRPRPSSPCWCCSARCWSCARAKRPRARSARCSTCAEDRAARARTTAATRRSRSTRSRSATGCACGRARRCRSTAR